MGLEVFLGAVQHYGSLKAKGELESVQSVIFEQGDVTTSAGVMVLTGTGDQIDAVLGSDKHRELLTKAAHIVTQLRVQAGVTGDAIPGRIQELTQWRKEMGL